MFSICGVELAQKGYYVNLDSSTDRKTMIEQQIEKHNITDLHRFPALTDPLHQSSATKSQKAVFEEALKNNYETIFVAEDDFFIPDSVPFYSNLDQKDFKTHLQDVAADLKTVDWDVFMFGCTPRSYLIPETKNLAIIDKSTGAWAYLIKKRAYEFILEKFNYYRDYQAIDNILPLLNYYGFKTITAIPLLIHHAKGIVSTLQPGLGPVDYTNLIEGYYGKFLLDAVRKDDDYVKSHWLERNLSILFVDNMHDTFLENLRHCLNNLPTSLRKCRTYVYYVDSGGSNTQKLISYFRDRPDLYFVQIELFSNMDNAFRKICDFVTTDYLLTINPKFIFTDKNLNFTDILNKVIADNIDSLSFNVSDNIDNDIDMQSITPINKISNTVTLYNTKYYKTLLSNGDGLFFDKDVSGNNMLHTKINLGQLNFISPSSLLEEKTNTFIQNRPLNDN